MAFLYKLLYIFVTYLHLMKNFLYFVFVCLFVSSFSFAQVVPKDGNTEGNLASPKKETPKARADQYKIISIDRDTTYIDTSLTIKSDYKYNYLRRDNFGLLPFPNEGQTYNTLNFGLKKATSLPDFGFTGKQFAYLNVSDIKYYNVATPITDLYFKTVMEQGQGVDALIAVNTTDRLNFSVGYRGLRSLGKYINQLSSIGNFQFTTSYNTKNSRYSVNAHFTGQDILNGENGGITTLSDFENDTKDFKNRARLQVYFTDAKSFLKGKRFFINHNFRINAKQASNNLYISHEFNLENKFYEFNQKTLTTKILNDTFQRFGASYISSDIIDQTRYQRMYNKLGAVYENTTLGKFQFFIEDFVYNYKYNKILILDTQIIPANIFQRLNAFGGQYSYEKNNWKGNFIVSKSISNQTFSTVDATLKYKLDNNNSFSAQYQNISSLPNINYLLHQSSYIDYNWKNDFKNQKTNSLNLIATTKWFDAEVQYQVLNDYLYFSNDDSTNKFQLVTPKQYDKTINYLSLKISKEIKYKKFGLENTFLYQNVSQESAIVNVPQLVGRNTIYFTNHFFKKALYLQTGITANYFTEYYANDYNPVLGDFFVQNQTKIGNFPMLDFFVNARIRQARIFLKAEHFNSSFTGNKYYSAPNTPYHDFMIRFGIVWTFFQ